MSLFHAALQPALDADGSPISGARWRFTLTGTTTNAAVYANAALGSSLGPYVESNAAGRFVNIFFDDAVTYRARLFTDSTETTAIKDIDPANGDNIIAGVSGDDENVFQITFENGANALNVDTSYPFVSSAGTRTTRGPRVTGGYGTDAEIDSFITSNCVANGTVLFRDEFQDMSTFDSEDGAHASFDAFCNFTGSTDKNHHRNFQARGKVSMSATSLLAEYTGLFIQPIYNGTFNVDQLVGIWIRDVQVDSGTQGNFNAYGILIDDLPDWGNNVYAIFVSTERSYFGGDVQIGTTKKVYDAAEVEANQINATGAANSYGASGGLTMYAPGGGFPPVLEAYTDATGADGPLEVRATQVRVGSNTNIASKKLEVTGDILASGDFYRGSTKVLGAQGAAVADATDAASVIARLNDLLARLRTHGIIAT